MKTVKKNKKLFIIIAIAVIILALGLFTSLFSKSTQIFSTVDECNVTIKYVIDGEDKPFKVYSQVHEKGQEINIKSPVKEGYSPDQEKIVALVKSDMIFIVKYKCSHFSNFINDPISHDIDYHVIQTVCCDCGLVLEEDQESHYFDTNIIKEPTVEEVGLLEKRCLNCNFITTEQYSKKSITVTFGRSDLCYYNFDNTDYHGYIYNGEVLALYASAVPEFDALCEGIELFPYGNNRLNEAITVELEYDQNEWCSPGISFKRSRSDTAYTNFSISVGNSWRFILMLEDGDVKSQYSGLSEAFYNGLCPVDDSPIKIKVTVDYSKL